jgi:hypothetical protein
MSSDSKQSAVEWLENELKKIPFIKPQDAFAQAKEMEKEQKNKMPIHIHEGISNTWVYIEDGVVHVKPNEKTYGGNK